MLGALAEPDGGPRPGASGAVMALNAELTNSAKPAMAAFSIDISTLLVRDVP